MSSSDVTITNSLITESKSTGLSLTYASSNIIHDNIIENGDSTGLGVSISA